MKITFYIQLARRSFIASVISACCLLAFTSAQAQVNLTNGLWAYFGFNDGTATNYIPGSPSGTLIGNPVITNGWFQNALSFDGSSSTVTFGSVGYFYTPTASAYVKLAAPLAPGTEQQIINNNQGNEGFVLCVVQTNSRTAFSARFRARVYSWGYFYDEIRITSLTSPVVGQFYHVALSFDGGTLHLYVNGVEEARQALTGGNGYYGSSTSPDLAIGSRDNAGNYFNGIIDEVYIYTRVLSLAEIQQLETPPLTPYITQQPVGVTATLGSNATFAVSASAQGALPLFYQWQLNGTNLVANTNLVGVASSLLSITNIQSTNLGFYSVVITNVSGSVTSSCVLLGIANTLDTDGDGIPDWWENTFGLNPNNPNDATNHPPGDKLTYLQKYLYGLDPLTIDTDGDGVSDYDELFVYGTNPQLADTDGDGIPDGWEIQYGLNPLVNSATNQAGFVGVTYLQIYQYNLTHTNQLDPRNYFPQAGTSLYELVNGGAHTNRLYYDQEDRLVGEECSSGISIAYTYDGNGNIVRQTVLSRASETNGLPVLWQFLNGLTNGTAASGPNGDPDGDGWSNYQEYLAGTSPVNSQSNPNHLGPVGNNIASLTLPFTPTNFVVGVGQLDGSGAEEIVVGADGNPGTNINFLLVLTQTFTGWSTQRVNIGSFGVTSLAVGQPANRPTPAIYAGLRQTGGSGRILELINVNGSWQTNTIAISTNASAFVLGVRSNLDLLVSYTPSNGIDGGLYSIAYSTNWNSTLLDTNTSHRGLGTVAQPQLQFNSSALRLLDAGGIAAGTAQISALIPNLISYWKLDESSGNAADSIGSNTLINNNAVAFDSGKINNGADFGSNNANKSLSNGGGFSLVATNPTSYSVWAKLNTEISSGVQSICAFVMGTGKYMIIQYDYNGGARRLNFYYGRGGVNNFVNYYAVTLGTSSWHHFIFTDDGLGNIKGYLDGTNIMSAADTGAITSTSGFSQIFSLGTGWDSGSIDQFISAKVDEVGLWSRALSAAEVSLLYGNGNGMPYSTSFLLPEPPATNRHLWRGQSLTSGLTRSGQTNGNSVFYVFGDDVNGDGQLDAGDDFVTAEYSLINTNATLTTLSRQRITSLSVSQSYGLASVNFLNSSNEILFTGEPDGKVFAWTATGATNPLQRQLFSSQYNGKAWHALTAVKTLEPGEGLAGLCVDPTNQNTCNVILWPSQTMLATLPQPSVVETAPIAAVVPSSNPLGSNAVVTIRLWDNEGNASTPFLQYQILGSTNWLNSTLTTLDGAAYSLATRVTALPGGYSHTLRWNALADVGANVVTNILLRASAQDYALLGNWSQPTPFQLNTSIAINPTNPPVNFTGITPVQGGIQFNWQGSSNAWLYLQRSPALAGTNANWVNIWTGAPPTLMFGSYTDFFGTNPMGFYRFKVVNP